MKKIYRGIWLFFVVIIVALTAYYLLFFVKSREIKHTSNISITNYRNKAISLQVTDSYFFISSIDTNYSNKRDTLFLVVKESTLANIFVKNKRGDKIVYIDSNVKVINYCGINKEFMNFPVRRSL